jgi:hypothetical protein
MTIEIKPETGKLVQEEIQSGHVGSVDELIVKGIEALREKSIARPEVARQKQRKHLVDVLSEAPFAGSDLIWRDKGLPQAHRFVIGFLIDNQRRFGVLADGRAKSAGEILADHHRSECPLYHQDDRRAEAGGSPALEFHFHIFSAAIVAGNAAGLAPNAVHLRPGQACDARLLDSRVGRRELVDVCPAGFLLADDFGNARIDFPSEGEEIFRFHVPHLHGVAAGQKFDALAG